MNPRAQTACTGFTLVETAVAMLILGLGLAAAWSLSGNLFRMSSFTANMTEATVIATDKMEELLATDLDALTDGSNTVAAYQCSWMVAAGPLTDTRALNVTVRWNDVDGHPHQAVLAGMASK